MSLLSALSLPVALAQEAGQKPAEKPAAQSKEKKAAEENKVNAAQIELLETKVRFESNGDSRKEVHTVVKINSEAGARQFARLTFDFNRSFETVEIPFVRITHVSGGTADILPSAISDQPNPAVVNAPAYQDVRVKSLRILGLEPSDTLEYRVIRTVSRHPLAPDFWLDHTFDRSGLVSHEIFELDLPASRKPAIRINPAIPAVTTDSLGEDSTRRLIYRWNQANVSDRREKEPKENAPDIMVTTFVDWDSLSVCLAESLRPLERQSGNDRTATEVLEKAKTLITDAKTHRQQLEAIYDFVSQKIQTVDLPLGSTGFAGRPPREILGSQYATAEDKYALFAALVSAFDLDAGAELLGTRQNIRDELPRPSPFEHLIISIALAEDNSIFWLDPSLEVAPFNMLPSKYRGAQEFFVARKPAITDVVAEPWDTIPVKLPFPASQGVSVAAQLAADGKLNAKVHYSMRGDNELLLRLAFHQSPKEKWKELAQLLSLTDGFRGEVSNVTASDPYATREPFTLDYEITQPKFVDWSKKTVRIPALLPQLGLPDPPGKGVASAAAPPIDLGTPLEVETQMTLRLPPGTTVATPTGTSVERDYATYSSQYAAKDSSVTASRHIRFILREIPGSRAADYNAFLRAVQSDAAQVFTLGRAAATSAAKKE